MYATDKKPKTYISVIMHEMTIDRPLERTVARHLLTAVISADKLF